MKDEELALLEFRTTPISGMQKSPVQLFMSWRLRSALPMTVTMLQPHVSADIKEKLTCRQATQKKHYDNTSKNLPTLQPNDVVRYQGKQSWEPAVVLSHHPAPRSYNIKTPDGTLLRRNRRHLKRVNETPPAVTTTFDEPFTIEDSEPAVTNEMPLVPPPPVRAPPSNERRTRIGRIVQLPARFCDDNNWCIMHTLVELLYPFNCISFYF